MKPETQNLTAILGEPVSIYTRARAIADGLLVDVSDTARKAGFRIPVAITTVAWNDCVAWREADGNQQAMQDEASRLWDILLMASFAARKAQCERYPFQLYRVPRCEHPPQSRLATLHLHIGPGDAGEPVTILMPNEA